MSGVYSLSTTVEITFIIPNLYLKKSTKKQLNSSNSVFCSRKNWVTFHHFFFIYHPQKYLIKVLGNLLLLSATYHWLIIPKSTFWKFSIIWLLLKPLPRPWTRILDPDPEKPGLLKTWALKNLNSENPGLWNTRGNSWMQQKRLVDHVVQFINIENLLREDL